jgi:hypothetical protein
MAPLVTKLITLYVCQMSNFDRSSLTSSWHVTLLILYVFSYIIIASNKQISSRIIRILMHMQLNKEKPCIGNIKGN